MNNIEWRYCNDTISKQDLDNLERKLNVYFPEEYKSCVMKCNGGRPSLQVFDFKERAQAVFLSLIRVDEQAEENIEGILKGLKGRVSDKIIPFARDPFGNLLCFDFTAGNDPEIVFWDHEKLGVKALSYICDSFDSLLKKLYKPTE